MGSRKNGATGLCALALALGVGACGAGKTATIAIGGWGGVFDEATQRAYLNEFDAAAHVDSRFVDTPGEQLARLETQRTPRTAAWDAVDSLGAGSAYALYAKGRLLKLPAALEARLRRELGAANVTPFGFAHGSHADVIVCNMAKMTSCPATMTQFYEPRPYPQPRTYPGIEPIEAVTTAQIAEGWHRSWTSVNPIDPPSVFEQLYKIRPEIKAFWYSGPQQLQLLRSGEVDLGLMWSDVAYQLLAQGMHLQINWQGGAYEPSYWVVPKDAPDRRDALKLLWWIASHPRGEATWAQLVHSSVPNPAARAALPASLTPQLADNPVNAGKLAVPNFAWYAEYGASLDAEYEDFVRG
jgi:putative spermidine/putrescine transport system substrate-binding protein